jgi:2-polyprenyl-3-methyl-5-hydroxy-6-metoxy-1,4-benzoquinol methylase
MSLESVLSTLRSVWPEHERFVAMGVGKRSTEDMAVSEELARVIARLARDEDGLRRVCDDYRWMCDRVQEEELEFRRTNRYRFSRLADVESFVYGEPSYMNRYLNGLLLSQLLWTNHFQALATYRRDFLSTLPRGFNLLEVGPGHGLFTYFASQTPGRGTIRAWDISDGAVELANRSLALLGAKDRVFIERVDAVEAARGPAEKSFDGIVLSEVLEHLEDPLTFLRALSPLLAPGGTMFINVPVNSPAIDHLFLLSTPEEAMQLVRDAGLEVIQSHYHPMTGWSLDRARKMKGTISCVFVARLVEGAG